VSLVGAPFALAADALSYLVSGASLASIDRPEPEPAPPTDGRSGLRAEMAEGLRATFGDPILRAFAAEAATFNLFVNVILAAFLLFATHELGLDPAVVGTILAVGALGSLGGSLVAARLAVRFGLGPTILGVMFLACLVYLAVPFAGGPTPIAVAILTVVFVAEGAGVAISNVHVVTIRQSITPDRLLARMNASYRAVVYGVIPIGSILGGVIGELLGLRAALLVGALGIAVAPLWIVASPIPRIRRLGDLVGPVGIAPPPPGETAATATVA
jgi:MFS family permease